MPKEVLIVLACMAAIGIIVYVYIRNKHIKIVKEKSRRLQELYALNHRTVFYGGDKKEYAYHQSCHSKRQFDNWAMEEYLIAVLDENQGEITTRLYEIDCNRKHYAAYLKEAELIVPMATAANCEEWKIPYKAFLWHEKRLFKKALLKRPQSDIYATCRVSYTSPQGKNHYEKEQKYDYAQLKDYFERLSELRATRRTRQYQIKVERAKMTDSLRYDIMKRDKFRCQLCGSMAADGVKLHVDHIQPVAKGGKTTPQNLRTLCDRCNMGKSDKSE